MCSDGLSEWSTSLCSRSFVSLHLGVAQFFPEHQFRLTDEIHQAIILFLRRLVFLAIVRRRFGGLEPDG